MNIEKAYRYPVRGDEINIVYFLYNNNIYEYANFRIDQHPNIYTRSSDIKYIQQSTKEIDIREALEWVIQQGGSF